MASLTFLKILMWLLPGINNVENNIKASLMCLLPQCYLPEPIISVKIRAAMILMGKGQKIMAGRAIMKMVKNDVTWRDVIMASAYLPFSALNGGISENDIPATCLLHTTTRAYRCRLSTSPGRQARQHRIPQRNRRQAC